MSRPQAKGSTEKVAPVEEKQQQPKSTHEAVEDLERRLAMLGSATTPAEEAKQETKQHDDPPPAFAIAVEPPATAKAGKNALLVRTFVAFRLGRA